MIRTYSRKPQECRLIEGVEGLCRLCLGPAADGAPIFAESAVSALALRVMICVGLEIKNEDSLPNLICKACCKELEHFYTFRKKCEASNQKLKSHVEAARIKHSMETVAAEDMAVNSLKDVDVSQDEKIHVNELELNLVESEVNNIYDELELGATPAISNVRSENFKIETENSAEGPQTAASNMVDSEQLSSLISSVLLKIGVLVQRGGWLRCAQDISHIQLETGDGGLVQMELVEEEDSEPEITSTAEEDMEEPALLIQTHVASKDKPKTKREPRVKGGGWRCAECGRCVKSRSALRRHARTHSGERPFACPDCARRFAQKEVMLRHRLVHRAVRPFKCAQCPKSFTQRASLAAHSRAHLPPAARPLALHRCPHCPKLFLHASGLSRHVAAHGGRVFECGACRRQFTDRSAVLRHVRRARHARPPHDTHDADTCADEAADNPAYTPSILSSHEATRDAMS